MATYKLKAGDKFFSKNFKGQVTVDTVMDGNEPFIDVTIDPLMDSRTTEAEKKYRQAFSETWNLQHTVWGLEHGDYYGYVAAPEPAPAKSEFEKAFNDLVRYQTDVVWASENEVLTSRKSEGTVGFRDILWQKALKAAAEEYAAQTSKAPITDEKYVEAIKELHEYAVEIDKYCFALPIYGDHMKVMVNRVKNILEK